jgi:hypothetical protein
MNDPKVVNKIDYQKDTVPLRFRIRKEDFKELQVYAGQNGYLTGKLAKAIIESWLENKVYKPRKAEAKAHLDKLIGEIDDLL